MIIIIIIVIFWYIHIKLVKKVKSACFMDSINLGKLIFLGFSAYYCSFSPSFDIIFFLHLCLLNLSFQQYSSISGLEVAPDALDL